MTDEIKEDPDAAKLVPLREDKRRPRALLPYAALWVIAGVCVIFALVELLNRA